MIRSHAQLVLLALLAGTARADAQPTAPARPQAVSPGKAPVYARVTKVDAAAGTFDYVLLYDEVVNTERLVVDDKGKTIEKKSDSVMTSRPIVRSDRSLKGSIVSTGHGKVVPGAEALKALPGKLVLFCDDFDGLDPQYRKLLAEDAWVIEVEKPNGLRRAEPSGQEKEKPPADPKAQEKEKPFDPVQLVGAWKLVSGEARGKKMEKESTGGIFVFTKDTLTGKSRFGEEKSWMSYTLDTTKTPVTMKLTVTKNFVGATASAIVDIRDGKLYLCYGKEPTLFTTKEGDNNRSMVFVKSVDPAEVRKGVEAVSEKKWKAVREHNLQGLIELTLQSKFTFIGRDGKRLMLVENFLDLTTIWTKEAKEFDTVAVSEQSIVVYGDAVVETGRAVATKKDAKEPAWDVRYTTTWVREDGKWYLASEHQTLTPAK